MIFQIHPDHGRHIAYSPLEAEANRKRGWKDVTKEEFYGPCLPSKGVPAVEEISFKETIKEAPSNTPAVPKKRGRPKLNANRA